MNRTNIMEILLSHGADVNAMSDAQLSLLHAACAMKSREAIELLIKHGADVHQFSGKGFTCFMHAVKRADLCLLLIEDGASVNMKDKYPGQHGGNTVLHCAIQEGNRDPVELLITQDADFDIQNNSGDNAFHAAVFRGCSDVLDVITKLSQPSIQRQIETHELLGCHFADERDDKEKALGEWRTAVQMREEHDMLLSSDDIKPPLPVT
ncbi:hypothetical protein CAPTEDRAFT_115917 [Capitella teleta]|uniref:Uncharacterized protein n=1 Tax=Capitella teleta TaxID=283909 RepID=R7UQQ4_CAPTE|nr:hypothetical protein CAPTEDRAFT_115917 [Capitella teleta]|eukprot:ELU06267.1 hypothetical protein CAPTEDRAFT_115917 [Capitella teleta]